MKKFLAILLGIVMCFGATALVGCGSQFDGNYKEVDATQLETFAASAAEAETKEVSLDGAKLVMSMESIDGEEYTKTSMDVTLKVSDDVLQLAGSMKSDMKSESYINEGEYETMKTDAKVYMPGDGFMYTDGSMEMAGEKESVKVKTPMPFSIETYISMQGANVQMDVADIIEATGVYEDENVKFYLDDAGEGQGKKFKVVVDVNDEEGVRGEDGYYKTSVKAEYYVIMDKDYNVTAFKVTGEINTVYQDDGVEESSLTKVSATVELWDGEIEFPEGMTDWELMDM